MPACPARSIVCRSCVSTSTLPVKRWVPLTAGPGSVSAGYPPTPYSLTLAIPMALHDGSAWPAQSTAAVAGVHAVTKSTQRKVLDGGKLQPGIGSGSDPGVSESPLTIRLACAPARNGARSTRARSAAGTDVGRIMCNLHRTGVRNGIMV